jgi:hypothetical protein
MRIPFFFLSENFIYLNRHQDGVVNSFGISTDDFVLVVGTHVL